MVERIKFEFIITDYNMPLINGEEFIVNLRTKPGIKPAYAIILLSDLVPILLQIPIF